MTSFHPLVSTAPLIVYIDYKSPYAYVAKDPTYRLADELGIEIDWRPITLDIPSYLGSARLDGAGKVAESNRTPEQWSGVRYAYRDARRYAAERALTLRGTTKIWDSSLAAIGMLWAKRQSPTLLRRYSDYVYEKFWKRELDIQDVEVIEAALAAAGADVIGFRGFLTGAGRAEHDSMQQTIFDAGIFGVPSYVVDGEVFFGREHLPAVSWLLAGRRGPAPDVAYATVDAPDAGAAARATALTVCIDFKRPECYLAKDPTVALARRLGIDVDWQPFVGPALARPRPANALDDRGARHRRFRAEYTERDIRRYAAWRGLALHDVHGDPDSSLAGIGLMWAQRHDAAVTQRYVDLVFERYFEGSLRLDDRTALEDVLETAGASTAGFRTFAEGEARRAFEDSLARLRGAGVSAVPTYLVGDEPFVGRQHLPLIEKRLRRGR